MAHEDIRRLSLRFEGEVQGVGFRWTSQRVANKHGLTGWVKNEWDGSVSMELQGSSQQISLFFGELPHAWGLFPPNFIIAEKQAVTPREDEDLFRVKF